MAVGKTHVSMRRSCPVGVLTRHYLIKLPRMPSESVTPWIFVLKHQQQTAFENIVGKGEIAHNEQCLIFPQCFLLNQIIVSPIGPCF